MSASIEGTPIEAEPADDFLSRGPDAITPEPEPESPSWDAMVEDTANGPSRWRRAPLLVLAVLLVFVLAGAAWFAANIFMDGGAANPNSMAESDQRAPSGTSTETSALRRTSGQPLAPAASTALPDPEPMPPSPMTETPQPTAAKAIPPQPPTPVDPVTTDPQDAPRISNGQGIPDRTEQPPAMSMATNNPLPPATSPIKTPEPPSLQSPASAQPTATVPPATKPKPMAKVQEQPKREVSPPAKAAVKIDRPPASKVSKPVRPAKAKPAVKMASRPMGSYAVQLSSVKSSSIAKREMRRLSRRFGSVLDGTSLRIRTADLGSRGKVYRIQTAAILSSAQAKRMCGRLKSRKQPCFVVAR